MKLKTSREVKSSGHDGSIEIKYWTGWARHMKSTGNCFLCLVFLNRKRLKSLQLKNPNISLKIHLLGMFWDQTVELTATASQQMKAHRTERDLLCWTCGPRWTSQWRWGSEVGSQAAVDVETADWPGRSFLCHSGPTGWPVCAPSTGRCSAAASASGSTSQTPASPCFQCLHLDTHTSSCFHQIMLSWCTYLLPKLALIEH